MGRLLRPPHLIVREGKHHCRNGAICALLAYLYQLPDSNLAWQFARRNPAPEATP